jgi:hypothetical protein
VLAQTLSISRCTGPLADGLIEGGMPVGRVRKLAQATAFLGPTAALAAAAVCDDGPITVGEPLDFARPPWHACQTYRRRYQPSIWCAGSLHVTLSGLCNVGSHSS